MRANHIILSLAVAAAPRLAVADPVSVSASAEPSNAWHFGIEPQFGVLVPTSKLHTFVTGGFELDYAIGKITIGADVALTQPSYSSTVMDMRVPGGEASYTIHQTELVAGLLASYRFATSGLVPRVGAGPIVQMLRTHETTSLSPDSSSSQQTKVGFQVAGGIDYQAGPGYLAGDIRFLYSSLDTMLTGSTNAGSIAVLLGYRIVF